MVILIFVILWMLAMKDIQDQKRKAERRHYLAQRYRKCN